MRDFNTLIRHRTHLLVREGISRRYIILALEKSISGWAAINFLSMSCFERSSDV
jgi:hypothetical protein